MGRTTTEKKDKKIDLRISQEMYDELAKEGKVSEVIRERIRSAGQKKNMVETVAQEDKTVFSGAVGKDLEDMLKCFKKNPDDFLKDVHGMFEEGKLTYENGRLEVDVGFEYQGFLDWCKDHRANPRIVFQNIGKEIGF